MMQFFHNQMAIMLNKMSLCVSVCVRVFIYFEINTNNNRQPITLTINPKVNLKLPIHLPPKCMCLDWNYSALKESTQTRRKYANSQTVTSSSQCPIWTFGGFHTLVMGPLVVLCRWPSLSSTSSAQLQNFDHNWRYNPEPSTALLP